MQIDKLVQLLESPVFVHLRLQLLDVESPHHAPLLKSCYGLLMLLPQSDAFRSLNDRLTTVCNLRDNLGIAPTNSSEKKSRLGKLSKRDHDLLSHFDKVMEMHRNLRGREMQQLMASDLRGFSGKSVGRIAPGGSSGTGVAMNGTASPSVFYTAGSEHGGSSVGASNRGRTQEV